VVGLSDKADITAKSLSPPTDLEIDFGRNYINVAVSGAGAIVDSSAGRPC